MKRWRGGDQVLVRLGGDALIGRVTWVRGRVLEVAKGGK